MPSWGEILTEINESAQARNGMADFDGIRRRYLADLSAHTGRPTIIYYSDWLRGGGPQISLEDMVGLMEVCRGMPAGPVDVILHSPGGSAEATASIVRYLRRQFTEMRVFVPLAAMSAATMWALAADRIVMGSHSQLGPIDP
jgi:ClpP class serine protease